MTITGKSSKSGTHYWRAWKAGQIYDGAAYEDYSAGSYADYDIAATSEGLGIFTGTVPNDADFAELAYQSGGSPAAGDSVEWILSGGELKALLALPDAAAGANNGLVRCGTNASASMVLLTLENLSIAGTYVAFTDGKIDASLTGDVDIDSFVCQSQFLVDSFSINTSDTVGISNHIFSEFTTSINTEGSIGKLIVDNLDAKVSEAGAGAGDATAANQATIIKLIQANSK